MTPPTLYVKRAISPDDAQRVIKAMRNDPAWTTALAAGACTTEEFGAFLQSQPTLVRLFQVAAVRALVKQYETKVAQADIAAHGLRKPRPEMAVAVERHRAWLPGLRHFADRAVAALDYADRLDALVARNDPAVEPAPVPPAPEPVINLSPVINLTVEQPREPQQVEVVALPARETTSTVKRDTMGNIVSTNQIERDLAVA